MDRAEALARVARGRSGHLATIRPDGRPHVVVVTYALAGDRVVTAIDHKPKRTQRLQRLANIESNPDVSFLVDSYEENWDRLWWVRLDGTATTHTNDAEVSREAISALSEKYSHYRERPPDGPVIEITPDRVTWWESTG